MTSSSNNTPSPKNRKLQKRADALRENLLKRKRQDRARNANEKDGGAVKEKK